MATKAEILAPLNDQQRDAVIDYNGKIMIEAGAGSGKTKSIVARCQYMILSGVKPSNILVFTFTRKAAAELRARIAKAIGTDADKMTISTYHSFCCKLLREFYSYIGRTRNFSIYDTDDSDKVLGPIVKSYFKGLGVEPLPLPTVRSYISKFKSDGLSPQEAKVQRTKTSFERACAFIYESYEKKLQEANAVDFDDLTMLAYKLLNNNPEVQDRVASRYSYIISDENQDSSKQNMAFTLLLGGNNPNANITIVGDTDQSIYKFRGSDVANIIDVAEKFGFRRKILGQNYRSTQTIVNASMAVIKHNKTRMPKETFTANEKGDSIAIVRCSDLHQEAQWICQQIKNAKTDENSYSDFAILCRTGSQTRNFEEAFLEHHIPFNLKGVVPFYCRSEIRDILAYLRIAHNSSDIVALERIINIPKRGIGKTAENKLFEALSKHTFNDIIHSEELLKSVTSTKKARTNLVEFYNIILSVKEMIDGRANVADILKFVIDKIDYIEYLKTEHKVESTCAEKQANVSELLYIAGTYTDVEEFLSNALLDNPDSSKQDESETEGVNILTIHSSKGLEYPYVFISGCTDSLLPYYRSHTAQEDIEEERRLCYVAMTRAEKSLCLTYPQSLVVNGREQRQSVSRFIREIPKEFRTLYSVS